jgi:1,2-dihydroxy-3-keto-5-methylthiopentene dioxygenase
MKAYWLDNAETVSLEELIQQGIAYEKLDINEYQPDLERIKSDNSYVAQDIIEITPQMPNLEALLAKFDKEHLHTDDEVRFVLSGSGIFDIRSNDDRWMRVEVYSGDYISVPANRHHRFFCTETKAIRCVRLFKDNAGWTPIYREIREKAAV